jgi:hypothetical protein
MSTVQHLPTSRRIVVPYQWQQLYQSTRHNVAEDLNIHDTVWQSEISYRKENINYVFRSSASTSLLQELSVLIEDEDFGPVDWRHVFSSVGVVPTYRRGLLPTSSAWYQRIRLRDVRNSAWGRRIDTRRNERLLFCTAKLIKFIQLSSSLRMEAPCPFEVCQAAQRYFFFVHLNSFGRCTRSVELNSQFW